MIIYAHRGWHVAGEAENSLAAFRRAAAQGFGIETDLRTDRDGRIVLHHDRTVEGIPLDRIDLREIELRAGRPVPLLDDLLAEGLGVPLNLEVKTRAAWVALERRGLADLPAGTLLTSFVHGISARAAERGIEAGLLFASTPRVDAAAMRRGLRTIVVDYNVLDEEDVRSARSRDVSVLAYGPVSADEHVRVRDLGCRGVITDHPDLAADACR